MAVMWRLGGGCIWPAYDVGFLIRLVFCEHSRLDPWRFRGGGGSVAVPWRLRGGQVVVVVGPNVGATGVREDQGRSKQRGTQG